MNVIISKNQIRLSGVDIKKEGGCRNNPGIGASRIAGNFAVVHEQRIRFKV
ncbi:hypothetical protein HYZ41_03955 [archaeon]|nr:hypothetical protein [archaeon]